MALYQPTNQIPSSYTQGTIDVNDVMEISWQVNGNSAMTAFQIEFYLNDAQSTYIAATGKQPVENFYGTDRFGRPQFFTWKPDNDLTWAAWSSNKLINGDEYKYKITQFYQESNLEKSVSQNSFSVIRTRKKPKLTIYRSNEQFSDRITFPDNGIISTSIGFFHADYEQEQGDPIRWIRWQVAGAKDRILSEILSDTGDIYTPALNYEYNGFFNKEEYAIRCFGKSESGQDCDSEWVYFSINIPDQGKYDGVFTVKTLNKENAALLEWEGLEVIPSTVDPQGYEPVISNSSVKLNGRTDDSLNSVIWNKKLAFNNFSGENETTDLNFSTPWTALWKGRVENYSDLTTSLFFEGRASIIAKTDQEENRVSGSVAWHDMGGETMNVEGISRGISIEGQYTARIEVNVSPKITVDHLKADVNEFYTSDSSPVFSVESSFDNDSHKLIIIVKCGSNSAKVYGQISYTYNVYYQDFYVTLRNDRIGYAIAPDQNVTDYESVINGNELTLTLYGNSEKVVSAVVTTDYATRWKSAVQKQIAGKITSFEVSGASANLADSSLIQINDNTLEAVLYASEKDATVSLTATVNYYGISYGTQGKLFSINDNGFITLERIGNPLILKYNNVEIANIAIPDAATTIAIIIRPEVVNAFLYANDSLLEQQSIDIPYVQQPINSVAIYGGENGATVESVSVYQGEGDNILSLYRDDADFEPVWNVPDRYSLYMTANFNDNLGGGTGSATGSGFRIYRQEIGNNILTPVATVPSITTSIKDFGITSGKAYKYSLYAYDNNGAFMSAVQNDTVVVTRFQNYSLLVCSYDETTDEYHVRRQYLFALNLSEGSVSNNNNPALNANFTRYPTRMPSVQVYASGTLQGLIGAIYTSPAIMEQIGIYKRTAKSSTLDYFDNVDLEKELYDLSIAPYQLFLRDMKGRLRMIHTSAPITMTTNLKQKQQSISISLPWVEIGDASDVTVIQTPDDFGWDRDGQLLNVSLDVDPETGELSASYPFPYSGTKFFLSGSNKDAISFKTPIGVTTSQFRLSDVAYKPDDGELSVNLKGNREEVK